MTHESADIAELVRRARVLTGGGTYGNYEHPAFFVSLNDDRLYVGLNNKAGQGQPVTVYVESTQLLPNGGEQLMVYRQWVAETLHHMRRVMVLDDVAGV